MERVCSRSGRHTDTTQRVVVSSQSSTRRLPDPQLLRGVGWGAKLAQASHVLVYTRTQYLAAPAFCASGLNQSLSFTCLWV